MKKELGYIYQEPQIILQRAGRFRAVQRGCTKEKYFFHTPFVFTSSSNRV